MSMVDTIDTGTAQNPSQKLFNEKTKGLDEGFCCECSLRSRKLRICVTCALDQKVLKKDRGDIVLNVIDGNIEESIQKAKGIAICGDCALDGERHEGHKTKLLATLKNSLDDMLVRTLETSSDKTDLVKTERKLELMTDAAVESCTEIQRRLEDAFMEQTKGLDEGICSECSLRSRKLRICITCALEQKVLKKDRGDIVLNVIDDKIEAAIQEAKGIAICGDCALDGKNHENHKTIMLAMLKEKGLLEVSEDLKA